MQPKLKKCEGCDQLKHIWKKHNRSLYCKDCWSQHPDKGKKPLQAKKPMNKKSSKIQKMDALYTVLRESYLKHNQFCKAGLPGCQINATDVHHKKLRGNYYLDESTFLPVCRICHNFIHANPILSRELGFLD